MTRMPFSLSDNLIRIAYKKLKSSVYYDKTSTPLREAIVLFETSSDYESKLSELQNILSADHETWEAFCDKQINQIGYYMLPKKISVDSDDQLIMNYNDSVPKISKYQYYIKLDVLGHIIGVLWLLNIGKMIDDEVYEHSYGNRLNQHLLNENGEVTFSPTLFEPYILQYGSWRDRGLRLAEDCLDSKEDAFILTMDFQSFFYNVNIDREKYQKLLANYVSLTGEENSTNQLWLERVHTFVWCVIEKYTSILVENHLILEVTKKEKETEQNRTINSDIQYMLPIGFLPSNILSNWVLSSFDEAIINRWNPLYYGRYVDDIIIVDKVEKGSTLYKAAHAPEKVGQPLSSELIVDRFLCNCRNTEIATSCKKGILIKDSTNSNNKSSAYRVSETVLGHKKSSIEIQPDKLKVFYFRNGTSKALLNRFREDIAQNASEFRMLPELDDAITFGNYSHIISLKRDDTINKLRGITSMSIDRFELSKFLGKYSIISSLIDETKNTAFERDLLTIFDNATILDNYTLWERLLEILVISNNWSAYTDIVIKISNAIEMLRADQPQNIAVCLHSLYRYLFAAINRTSALCWNKKAKTALEKIQVHLKKVKYQGAAEEINDQLRMGYLNVKMVDKTAIPVFIDAIDLASAVENGVDLTKLKNLFPHLLNPSTDITATTHMYPYWVKPQELSFSRLCQHIRHSCPIPNDAALLEYTDKSYWHLNYPHTQRHSSEGNKVTAIPHSEKSVSKKQVVHVDTEAKTKLRVAIGNAKVEFQGFEDTLKKKGKLKSDHYKQLSHIMDEAIREKCDLLVLPELYMPIEWLPVVAKKCASIQMGLVTGVSFIIGGGSSETVPVYNLTAVILPYEYDEQKHAYISYHHKVHYSPAEQEMIRKYGYTPMPGKTYQLYSWHDIWFSVYCCFELASIQDRALFSSLSDITIGVEWNKDTLYFDHISSALSRDLYCYVIEANTAQYGGSGVVQPQSSATSEIIRTKGGDNCSILTTTIDVQALREAQFPIIADRKPFKPLPPIVDRKYIEARYRGTLWKMLKDEYEKTL